jgi:hypothetical protein
VNRGDRRAGILVLTPSAQHLASFARCWYSTDAIGFLNCVPFGFAQGKAAVGMTRFHIPSEPKRNSFASGKMPSVTGRPFFSPRTTLASFGPTKP